MSEPKTVSTEQLEVLRNLQTQFDDVTKAYGELRFQQIMLEDEMDKLSLDMRTLEATRMQVVNTLQEEFGTTGSVNLQTGEFIPD